MNTTEGPSATAVGGSALSEGLGPLPEAAYPDCVVLPRTGGVTRDGYSYEQMLAFGAQERAAERKRFAQIARNGCLVPPDGGSPTEEEAALCAEIERRILGAAT